MIARKRQGIEANGVFSLVISEISSRCPSNIRVNKKILIKLKSFNIFHELR